MRLRLRALAWLLAAALPWPALPAFGQTQFSDVWVRMQSGREMPLMDLPWFRFALNVSESQWKNRAADADWILYSPPRNCSYSSWFWLRWQGNVENDKAAVQQRCNTAQAANSGQGNACDCKLVLQTIKQAARPGDRALWQSFDDELLLNDELRLRRTLVAPDGQRLPVLVTLGGSGTGLQDFQGNALCRQSGVRESSSTGGFQLIQELLRKGDRPVPVACLGGREGSLDISRVSYSVLRSRLVGDAILSFQNGERYVIAAD